jgi:hypothetical protein
MPPLYRQSIESGTSFTNLSLLLIFTRRKTKLNDSKTTLPQEKHHDRTKVRLP